ncbi:MAG: acetyl-CoA decarbonylase/synthase complex subunit gamma [Methanoregulaceae archaeon]
MTMKALDIYKLLPKKNCKECGDPTCLTFAMKLSQGKADPALCPYLDENAKSVLGASTRPPIKLVKIGVGERNIVVGEEFVFFRHEKTFVHPPGILFRVQDTQGEQGIRSIVREVRNDAFVRVGIDLKIDGVAIENTSGDPAAFGKAVEIVESEADLPLVLKTSSVSSLDAALIHCGSYAPLIHAATEATWKDFAARAVKHGCPLAVRPGDFSGLAALVKQCTDAGVQDLVIDLTPSDLGDFLAKSTRVRKEALARTSPEYGYPVFLETRDLGMPDAGTYLGILKFASVIVTDSLSPAQKRAALTLRQNIYTDPQKPIQMTPGIYRVGVPTKDSPLLMTVNFSLTYFTLQGYLEATRIPCYLLLVDTEGLSVLTAVASGKLSEMLVRDSLKKFGVEELVSHRNLIIPGYASPLSGRIEDATGWHVLVGPRDAAEIGDYLDNLVKP